MMKELSCKNCGNMLTGDQIVVHLAMARCNHCNSVFSLESSPAWSDREERVIRPKVPMPAGFQVQEQQGVLEIKRSWWTPAIYGLIFFAVVWNGFMVVWHGIALSEGIWFMSLFGLLHTAVGVGLVYYIFATFMNTTTIHAGMGVLEVRHGPVPWPGSKVLSTDDCEQIYCKENVRHGKNGTSMSYSVQAIRQDGVKVSILENLQSDEQALFIEQELEAFLELVPRPVKGAYDP